MPYILKIFCLIFVIVYSSAQATQESYSFKTGAFSLEVPDSWQQVKETPVSAGMRSVPLTLFGPENDENARPVIIVLPIPYKDEDGFLKKTNKDLAPYKNSLNEWLASKGGTLEKVFPLETKMNWNHISEAYFLGASYILDGKEFLQKAAYIICENNSVFHLKGIYLKKDEKEIKPIIEKTFNSFTCSPPKKVTTQGVKNEK